MTIGYSLDDNMTVCGYLAYANGSGIMDHILCDIPVPGRYVKISINDTGAILTLCEVEVFGSLLNSPGVSLFTFTSITLIFSITVLLHVQCGGRNSLPCSLSMLLLFLILVVTIYSYGS